MRYVEARIDEYQREEAYRIYVTRSLQLIPQQKYIQSSYTSMYNRSEIQTNGDEIAVNIIKQAGLTFKE